MGRRSSGHIALSAAAALQDFSVYKKKLKDPEREEDPCCSELAEIKEESRVWYDSSFIFPPYYSVTRGNKNSKEQNTALILLFVFR
jgi:hypothetical protein